MGNLWGVERRQGEWRDLDSGTGERVLSLDQGMRGPGGEAGECKVEVIVPEVLHLEHQSKVMRRAVLCDSFLSKTDFGRC